MTPSTSPPPDDAADSSTASSTADGLYGDGGPAFNADAAPAEDVHVAEQPIEVTPWDSTQVRGMLTMQGHVVHQFAAIDKAGDEWLYTKDDLAAIAPPLTRILNRYDATKALAGTSDELSVVIGLSGYTIRSWGQRRAALARLAAGDDYPPPPFQEAEPEPAPDGDDDEATEIPPLGGRR